jgi:uncharacterized protein YdhG (YjbR/CyaY superfamily)
METIKPKSVDEYIHGFPEETQFYLEQIRAAVWKAAPDAQEVISYGIPAFMMNKTYLVYFAGYKKHVSMYPVPKGDEAFQKEISPYRVGKGTLQFTLEKKLPMRLISKIVKCSLKTNKERSRKKK